MEERLQKILAKAGVGSRRFCEELIANGKVKVNGVVATLGTKATFDDKILINNKPIKTEEPKVYYVLNKPPKTVCTLKDNFNRTKVTDLIDTPYKIFPVGRLDYDTTGVLLLTNDGDLAYKLTHPKYQVIRNYRARLNEPLSKAELKILNGEVKVNDVISKQNVIPVPDTPKSYFVVLTVGTYHHVKKLFETVNKKVLDLKRVEYGGVTVKGIPLGEYRALNAKELKILRLITKDK
ncbi:pseudouridine synthase [Mycoplasma corogypsi]|uniref:pseudouridine synthase n=1 Tax=Mycoplasma corogypsi TaxID=2106 RepID=UPI003872D42C